MIFSNEVHLHQTEQYRCKIAVDEAIRTPILKQKPRKDMLLLYGMAFIKI